MTDSNTNLLIIDSRVSDYQNIINAIRPGVRYIVFNTADIALIDNSNSNQTSFQYIQSKIAELGDTTFTSVGLLQHNMKTPDYQMFGSAGSGEVAATIVSIEKTDPTLQTWSGVAGFITALKTNYGIQNFDMMACALYSDPNWKYVIDTLAAQTGVTIRASTDDTGAAALGGDWFLESHTGVNLKDVYFTEAIEEYRGVLYVGSGYWGLSGARRRPIKSFAVGGLQLWGSSGYGGTNNTGVSLANTVGIISNRFSFAALKTDGSVVVWGRAEQGASYSALADNVSVPTDDSLTNSVVDVVGNEIAYAALKSNGSVVIWGRTSVGGSNNTGVSLSNVIEIYASSSRYVFFALKSDGSVVAWGDSYALTSEVLTSISSTFTAGSGIVLLYTASYGTVAALRTDGSVVACGISNYGGNVTTNTNGTVSSNVRTVYALGFAFVALKSDGSVVQWGNINYSSSVLPPTDASNGVIHVFTTGNAAHALKTDGSIVGWGNSSIGVVTSTVILICSNYNSSAALKSDGSVIAWGNSSYGGSTTTPPGSMALLSTGVIALYSNYYSYAALKSDGSVVCWGNSSYGGNTSSPSNVASSLMSGVVRISPTESSFAALKSDGSVIRWGNISETELQGASIDSGIVDIFNSGSAQVGIKSTSTPSYDLSMSYYTELDRLNILCSRDYRRTANLTANSNRFTLSSTRSLQKFNYTMPTNKPLTLIVPDYKTPPYSLTSTITLPTSIVGSNSMLITSEIGERVDISGVGTYVNYGTYVYKVESNGTYTRTTSLTINSVSYDLYGGDGVYLSGIALYNPTSTTPTLSSFSVSAKTYGTDTTFNLTDPTSNNTGGAFTFSSSNTQVATISGRTVTVVGPGTSVITASQGGSGNYTAASTTASLVVAFGNLSAITSSITNGSFVIPKPLSTVTTTYADYWNQLGGNITGEAPGDGSGTSVSISADGTVVAIGAICNAGNGVNAGHVRIYKYNANKTVNVTNQADASFGPIGWDRLGADIDGEWLNDYSGYSVSLSANGRIVAIGAYGNEAAATSGNDDRGHVRVYRYNENKTVAITDQADASFGPVGWDRLGADIDGLSRPDMLGLSVSISADGTVVACGATGNDNVSGSVIVRGSGTVRIFKYNASKTTAVTDDTLTTFGPAGWDQLGGNINGEAASDRSGVAVSLSADGTVVAIGSEYNGNGTAGLNIGHVRVYKYNANKTVDVSNQSLSTFGPKGWDRLGDDIDGEAIGDRSGYSVSISADGTTVAIGATSARAPDGYQYGHVRVYKYNANKASAVTDQSSLTTFGPKGWDRLGADIDGENINDYSGSSVSLSADGTIVAIGANGSDTLEGNSGHVRVYKYNPNKTVEQTGQQYVTFGPKGWDRIGRADIDGYGSSGSSVSISKDGTIVAIGAPYADDGGYTGNSADNRGSTRIYKIDSYGNYTYTSGNSTIADICGNIVLPKTGGSTTITITQSASGANASTSVTIPLTLKGIPIFQTYTIASKNFGATLFDLVDPSSNSTGAFTFTSSNTSVATISGRAVTIVGVGTTTITATQAASNDYISGSTSAALVVNLGNPIFQPYTIASKSFGQVPFTINDPSSNNLVGAFTYTSTVPGVATISPQGLITVAGGGTTVIRATQAATASYNTKFVDASFTVLPIDPTIGSLIAPAKNFGDASFNLTDPSSNNTVSAFTYSSSVPSVATVTSSGTVTVIGVGTTTITATQAATANYNEKFVTANLVVSASLSNFIVSAKNYGAVAFDLTDPSSTDNTVGFTFSSNNSTVATISGRTVTIHNAGSAVITATQAATSNRGQLDISATLVVNPIPPIITLPPITKIYSDVSFSLSPTSSNLTGIFSYSSSNPTIASIVDNSYVLIHNVGQVTIRISQTATNNYTAVNDVSSSLLTINKGTSSLSSSTFSVASNKIYGDVSFSIISAPTTNNQSSPLTYSSNNTNVATIDNSGVIQLVGFGNVTFTASQVESTLYNAASITSNQLSVSRKTVVLTRSSPSNETITKNYGNAPFTVSASNESNGVLSYESGNTSIATINSSSGEITIVSIGTVTISAYRSQTLQYTSTPISWNLQISRGTTSLSGLSSSTRNVTIQPFTVSASSATNGAGTVSYALQDPLSNVLTIHPTSGLVTLKAPGSAVIVASQTQGTLYEAPPDIYATITVQSAGNALQNASLTSSNNFNSVSLTGASMSNSTINSTTFISSILTNTNFNNTTITNSNFTNAELTNASFNNSNINVSTFTGASMSRSDLSGAVVRSSNFDNSDLSGSTLTRMDASGSSLINANLTRANLTSANLTNANLTNANISGANISNVSFSTLQKIQLLKNKENRSIQEIQVTEAAGTVILSAVSATSEVRNLPNIANTTFKVIVPATAVTPTQALSITNIVLDITNYTYFYFPINENEYFRFQDVIYYIQGTTVRNYATGNIVDITSYQSKAVLFITGSLTIVVNSQNTLFASPFVVPTNKITTDAPFNIITAPTSNSAAQIVYSSSNTNIATINSSTGLITLAGSPGFVTFTASQVATQAHEAGSVNSNVLCVNRLIDFTLPGLDQSFNLSTLALLDASGAVLETTDATAVFYVKLSDMSQLFQYQTDSFDINDISATDIKYYVFHRKWPTALKINPAHAMLNKPESSGILGGTTIFSANKMLAKHDFLRHISRHLFNTIHGVDLFNNESDLLENTTYWGENVRTTIDAIISGISTTSSDASLAFDSSGNKYLTNTNTGNTNLTREIMRQISAVEASRFNNIQDNVGLKSIPFIENDTLLFKVIFSSALNQSDLTNVSAIPSRSYMVKLIMKNDISGINANTVVIDSEMFPNAYPYSSSVTTYAPTSDSAATVYNVYSPPAPIPFSRFGFDGWYYANSNAWVNVNSGVRNHVKWILPGNNGTSTVGQLQFIRVNMKVYNKTSLPYIIIYTQSGSWRKYSVPVPSALVNETKYSFYVNFNSYARAPAIIGFTNILLTNPTGGGSGGGSFADSEQIMNIALETTVNETIDSVEFTLANIIVGDSISGIASEKEYGFEAVVPTSYP
jgi:uncharacterized protein YjbI with pentapeptide repeats